MGEKKPLENKNKIIEKEILFNWLLADKHTLKDLVS